MVEEKLFVLWTEERRLNCEWGIAIWRKEWTEAARIRKEYDANFDKLLALCRELNIIE